MERKTTQRIIGSLVAVAFVVILLPLLLSKNEASTPTTVKAPPFPDQTEASSGQSAPLSADITPEIASKVNQTTQQPSEIAGVFEAAAKSPDTMPAQDKPVKEVAAATPAPVPTVVPVSEDATKTAMKMASAATTMTAPSPVSEPSKPSPVAEKPMMALADAADQVKPVANDSSNATQEDDSDDMIAPAKPAKSAKPAKPSQPAKSTHLTPTKVVSSKAISKTSKTKSKTKPVAKNTSKTTKKTAQNHGTKTAVNSSKLNKLDLKKPAWVIQMGSFKDKNNARHLADKLRASGYKAFMHDVKSSHNNATQTRVYIGPESKQASALKLSNQVANTMDLHGVVVLYKPLEL